LAKIKWLDEYEIKARYIPTFLSVIPIVHFAIMLLGRSFWNELADNISWMPAVANISLSCVVMIALVQIQSGLGKTWIEESVFGKGGENFPTTDMLLFRGGLISRKRKEHLQRMISDIFGSTFSTEDEERDDPLNARLQAREAVGHVRLKVGHGVMTIKYNVRYGFFRNMIAGVVWGTVGSLGCSILYFLDSAWKPMSLFIACFLAFVALYRMKRQILGKLAFNYADVLFTEFSSQTKGE
jgi:uncharacterized membrane protein YeaQ/YmgE (transglycosylase-associated protein family)